LDNKHGDGGGAEQKPVVEMEQEDLANKIFGFK